MNFQALVTEQIALLQRLSQHRLARALAGAQADLDAFFSVQDRLEHWLQYLSPLSVADAYGSSLDAPPPLGTRPAPPLPHDREAMERLMQADYAGMRAALQADDTIPDPAQWAEEAQRPHVSFPPEPLWVEDLETPGEESS